MESWQGVSADTVMSCLHGRTAIFHVSGEKFILDRKKKQQQQPFFYWKGNQTNYKNPITFIIQSDLHLLALEIYLH